jgi:hypothetical protein
MDIKSKKHQSLFLLIMAVFLMICGSISLFFGTRLPINLLDGLRTGRLPIFETLLRGWLLNEKTTVLDFGIALHHFALINFMAAILFLILHLLKSKKLVKRLADRQKSYSLFLVLALAIIFLISVLIRLPDLNKPLGVRYEELTLDTLIRLENWKEQGALHHYLVPIDTYKNRADHNIKTWCGTLTENGQCYYLSYPPLAVILAYIPPALIHFQLTPIYLQIMNLFLHLLSAVFIFLLTALLTKHSSEKNDYIAPVLAYTFYLFTPLLLIFHSESYFSDGVVMPFFIGSIYFLLRLLIKEQTKKYEFIIFGLLIFLACYAEWLGILLALAIGLCCLFNRKEKKFRLILLITFIGASTAILLTTWQFFSVAGTEIASKNITSKLLYRSGIKLSDTLTIENPELFSRFNRNEINAWLKIPFYYIGAFNFFLILMVIAGCKLLSLRRKNVSSKSNYQLWMYFVFVAGLPPLLYHLLLFQWSTLHSFSPIKAAPLIIIVGTILIAAALKTALQKNFWPIAIGVTLTLMLFSFISFTCVHSYSVKEIGQHIKNLSASDETIFLLSKSTDRIAKGVLYSYYAKRNIADWNNLDQAKSLLKSNNLTKGILFEINETDLAKVKYAHFNLESSWEDIETNFNKYEHRGDNEK